MPIAYRSRADNLRFTHCRSHANHLVQVSMVALIGLKVFSSLTSWALFVHSANHFIRLIASTSEDDNDDKGEDNRKSKSKDQNIYAATDMKIGISTKDLEDDSSESAGKSEDMNSKGKMEINESDKQDKDRRQGNKDKKDDDGDVC